VSELKSVKLNKDYVELFEKLEPMVRVEPREAIEFLSEVGIAFLIGMKLDKIEEAKTEIQETLNNHLAMQNLTNALIEMYKSQE
jgi:hypothetical protein